jgi:beta-lactamase superfamily II metal-dependent hydrolase
MRGIFPPTIALLVQVALLAQTPHPRPPAQKPLDVYFLDTEGGQATLFLSPYGESMLVDTDFPGNQGMPAVAGGAALTKAPQITRDADRITGVPKRANIMVLDYVIITHYHGDHAGNAAELASRIPIRHFIDQGPYSFSNSPRARWV